MHNYPSQKTEIEALAQSVTDNQAMLLSKQIMEIIKKEKNLPKEIDKVLYLLEQLKLIEERQTNYLDLSKNEKLLQGRKKLLAKIPYSDAFTVDILFDERDILLAVNHINLRLSGAQNRHITAISIIEKIIKNVLVKGHTPKVILENLLHKLDFFSHDPSPEHQALIQDLVECYKDATFQYSSDINVVIKVIGKFYNDSPILSLVDKTSKYNNDCYLVPFLTGQGKKFYHKSEGSFITAITKALDSLEQKLIEKPDNFSELDLKRVVYIITAMFDYPAAIGTTICERNTLKKLRQAIIYHFSFLVEAYPVFKNTFYTQILDQFIDNVWFGITVTTLCEVMDVKHMAALVKEKLATKNINLSQAKQMFTSEEKESYRKGFAFFFKSLTDFKQYSEFEQIGSFDALKKEILKDLQVHDIAYSDWTTQLSKIELKEELAYERESIILTCIYDILYNRFCFDLTLRFNFANLNKQILNLLQIQDSEKFQITFMHFFVNFFHKSEKFAPLSPKTNTREKFEKLTNQFSKLQADDSMTPKKKEFENCIRTSIIKAYTQQIHQNIIKFISINELQSENKKSLELRKKLNSKLLDTSIDEESDSSYRLSFGSSPAISSKTSSSITSPLKMSPYTSQLSPDNPTIFSSQKSPRFPFFTPNIPISVKELQGLFLPIGWMLGEAFSKGDCFFDACAQALNQKTGKEDYTVKSLRLLCHDTLQKLEAQSQQSKTPNWVQVYLRKLSADHDALVETKQDDSLYLEYLANIRYTAEEIGQSLVTTKEALWGQPEVDGRILCEKLDIKLHVIEVQSIEDKSSMESKPKYILTHRLIDSKRTTSIEENKVDYQDEKCIHLVCYKDHFMPLLKSQPILKQDKIGEAVSNNNNEPFLKM